MNRNKDVADFYDKLYSEDDRAFGGEPLPLVKRLLEYIKEGDVLEIGAGAGRNSIFLASQGFTVTATDISSVSVKNIQKKATEKGVTLKTKILDAVTAKLTESYDIIICTFTLHHILTNDALVFIRNIQEHTKPSGFNLITTFTKDGDFYRENPQTSKFYLDNKEQLEQLYTGWKILRNFEKEGKARAVDEDGNHMVNMFVGLLAQQV